ncbi:DNA-3-methyladenine glycosylase 2 family protein [Rhodococcus rhodnii]|uniref:DNA-3-methyladenine glycosylase II n=1 Tax=Rhodococcus rhodnii TaxID=38312 RepID=A0A6P2CIZ2_9NOCA|nr:DNA-3-methyladenine glycosylase 2 family protein [Rhodococcus rhodnii]
MHPPFAADPLRRVTAVHAVPGVEEADDTGVRRTLRTPSGPAHVDVAWPEPGADTLTLTAAGPGAGDPAVETCVRGWLDLDVDPDAVGSALARFDDLAPLVRERPGLRILGSADPWETAASVVLGQQVSLAGARTLVGRLVTRLRDEPGLAPFPTARQVRDLGVAEVRDVVRMPRGRAQTLHDLAAAVCDGDVDLTASGLRDSMRAARIAGIGPWTTEYLALRLGDRDAAPTGDLVLRRALGGVTEARARAVVAPWSPLRAYGIFHVWTAASYSA